MDFFILCVSKQYVPYIQYGSMLSIFGPAHEPRSRFPRWRRCMKNEQESCRWPPRSSNVPLHWVRFVRIRNIFILCNTNDIVLSTVDVRPNSIIPQSALHLNMLICVSTSSFFRIIRFPYVEKTQMEQRNNVGGVLCYEKKKKNILNYFNYFYKMNKENT